MEQRQTQKWLQEIYRRPELYEGKVVVILNNTEIVGVAEDFSEADCKRQELVDSSPSIDEKKMTLYCVPYHVRQIRIRTLRMKSLRESLWEPTYPVTLHTDYGEIKACQMLIDSGADFSLITFQAGKRLGLSRRDEDVLLFAQGIGGEVSYLLRRIHMMIDQHPVSAAVAWCQDETINDMIVGRRDVFDAFHIEFRQSESRLIFKPVKDRES